MVAPLFAAIFLLLSSAFASAQDGGTPATVTPNDPIVLLDRALQETPPTGRNKELLLQLRERAVALKNLTEQLNLRKSVAEQTRDEAQRAWELLRRTPAPDLIRQFRTQEAQGEESATKWLAQTEEYWLTEKTRWTTELEQLRRTTEEIPVELTRPIDTPPPGADANVQAAVQLVRLQRESLQRLWQEVKAAEEAARAARIRLAQAQLEQAEQALAQLQKVRPQGAATDRWGSDPLAQQIAERNQALKGLLTRTTQQIEMLQGRQEEVQKGLEAYQQQMKRLEARAKTHGLTPLLAYQLIELRKTLWAWQSDLQRLALIANQALTEWQQIEVELVQAQQRQAIFDKAVEERLMTLDPGEQATAHQAFQRLMEERRATIARLSALRPTITQAASDLEATTKVATTFARQALDLLQGLLLWAKSALPWWSVAASEVAAVAELPFALVQETPLLISEWHTGLWAAALPLALLLVWWLSRTLLTRKFRALLPNTALRTAQGSITTALVLVLAALQALGVPLLLLTVGQLLRATSGPTLSALGNALLQVAFLWWNLHFWRIALTEQGGLAHYRYGLSEGITHSLRRNFTLFMGVTALLATVVATLTALPPHEAGGAPVRSALLVSTLWLTLFLGWLFGPQRTTHLFPSLRTTTRHLLWVVMVAPPAVATVLLLIGYLYSAEAILLSYWRSLWAVLIVLLAYDLIRAAVSDRWQTVARRKREAAGGLPDETVRTEEEKENQLAAIDQEIERGGKQLRRVMRWSAWFALGALLFYLWAPLFPALTQLDEWVLWRYQEMNGSETITMTVTAADLLFTLFALFLLTLLTRTAPTLLELLLAQTRRLDDGAKYAITTLFRYLILTVGVIWIFSRLGMPWSKLQWLVAALSVGLGFGLQEIVANFVSGLIILFERPVRVGDIVTVEGISGKVKRMTIRATILETLDKQEVLIPNKAIITGKVTNWTLSDMQSRLLLPVGVAYGSDLTQVQEVILAVARAHPNVLKEPAPTVVFVQFGPSSVDFELRCFVADLTVRGQTRTELALALDRAFRTAGIEIPFPQQDLHLRSIAPEVVAQLLGSDRLPIAVKTPTPTKG
ncbi:hypothetical protein JCM16106_13910 [Hydrogenophilus islandicus]